MKEHTVDENDTLFQQAYKLAQFFNQFRKQPYTNEELIPIARDLVAGLKLN